MRNGPVLSLRTYGLIVVLPVLILIILSVLFLGRDIYTIKDKADNFQEEIVPKVATVKDTITFLNTINHKVYLMGFASILVANDSYEEIKMLLKNIEHKESNKKLVSDLRDIKIELDSFIVQRNELTFAYSKLSNQWLMMLDDLLDIYRITNINLVGSKDSFIHIDLSNRFGFNLNNIKERLNSLQEPIDEICDKVLSDYSSGVLYKRCSSLRLKVMPIETSLTIMEDKFKIFDEHYSNILKMVDNAAQSYYSLEEMTLKYRLTNLNQEINKVSTLLSMTYSIFLVLLAIEHVVLFIIFVKPLRAMSFVIEYFKVHLKMPKELPRTNLKEAEDIFEMLYPILYRYNSVNAQNEYLSEKFDELKVITFVDDLTKVHNRRSLNKFLDDSRDIVLKNVAVLMVDIDFFKLVNDTAGHLRGDQVLFEIAKYLRENVCKEDHVYRYGGEEFCIILPDISKENALSVAQRLCSGVENLKIPHPAYSTRYITVSIGVSTVIDEKDSVSHITCNELISQADAALYDAKNTGRNKACQYKEA
ncbi:Bacteriophytochrome cph2 [Anaerobiospirillum thomasii]|uniref:diguanylate cyclase n=1 Tax=Anaerobiospirillum thomasii TaxID=179995 RepID=A0A2X0WY73_9GAMM|nr:diguanylate cyclase [Anaerobiospirillum thomasii]SPT68016.1 Bacteriophytochrome cph2 [Anaerobiospirillum thomasii]SPT70481.1 Bacteriophytochrome cph2 [Anaerobiospirillum thomasii]